VESSQEKMFGDRMRCRPACSSRREKIPRPEQGGDWESLSFPHISYEFYMKKLLDVKRDLHFLD